MAVSTPADAANDGVKGVTPPTDLNVTANPESSPPDDVNQMTPAVVSSPARAAAAAPPGVPAVAARTSKRKGKTKTPNVKAVIHSPLMKARKRLQNSMPGSAARQIAGLVNTVCDTPRKGASLRGNLARDLGVEVTCPLSKENEWRLEP